MFPGFLGPPMKAGGGTTHRLANVAVITAADCTRCGAAIQKELDRKGITTDQITSLPAIATNVGANRVVAGSGIEHPVGNPSLVLSREKAWRKRLLETALSALQKDVSTPTVFSA